MNITAGQKTKTGLFVAISLALLLGLIFLIGKQKNLFGNTFLVYAHFKNISGTKEGNYVRFAGINIGTVETISLVDDTTVRLALTIEKAMQPYIKADAVASIGSDGLMGDKLVLIAPGTASSPVLKNDGILLSKNPVDVDRILNNLTKISDNAEVVTGGLATIVTNINKGKGTIGRLIGNDNLADKMEQTIDKAQETVSSIKTTSKTVNEGMEAAKHNFLLRGYFKKKERKRIQDSIDKANKVMEPVKQKKDKD